MPFVTQRRSRQNLLRTARVRAGRATVPRISSEQRDVAGADGRAIGPLPRHHMGHAGPWPLGFSADPTRYSLRASVADMRAVMNACGVDRAAIGGLSLGGFVSLAFHITHPESTRALLLFDTGPAKKRSADERAPPTDRESQGLSNTRRGVLESADDEILASLGSIRVPTLIICGALDQRFLPASEFLRVGHSRCRKGYPRGREPRIEPRSSRRL